MHDAPEWQAAMEALILVAERGGPTMFARIGIMRALNRRYVPEFNPKGKEPSTTPPSRSAMPSTLRFSPQSMPISDNQRRQLPDANWCGTIQHGLPHEDVSAEAG